MLIVTDSGASLEVTPTMTQPEPANTPEVQGIPAGGLTPAQVVSVTQQAAANPPLTPVTVVVQYVPVVTGSESGGPAPGEVERTLQSVDVATKRPAGVQSVADDIWWILTRTGPHTASDLQTYSDSLREIFR